MSGLPRGWASATLDDLGDYLNGMAFKPEDWTGAGFPIIRIQNLTNPDRPLNRTERAFGQRYLVRAGDLLISWSATLDAFIWDREDAVLNQHIFKVTPSSAADPRFLYYASRQAIAELFSSDHLHGSTMKHINRGPFLAHKLGLPPFDEQRRIVAKLDALTARTARARADLDRIPALAARYKQAVLAKFFGELTSMPEKLIDLVDPERGIPYGIVQTGAPVPTGVPTVRCGDVRQFSVERAGLKIVSQDIADAYPRTRLRGGEVLLAIRGSVGNTAVAGPEFAGCNISREVALIPVGERLRARFAMFFLGSPEAQSYLKRHTKGVAQTGINLEDVRTLTIPVPELAVQDEIVGKIDRALAEIDRLTLEAVTARRLLDRLDQAVLAKAFRGELVPQDPADEPASVLLDRIRADRAASPKPKRGRKAVSA